MINCDRLSSFESKLLLFILVLGQLINSIPFNDVFDLEEQVAINNDAESSNSKEGKNLLDLMEDFEILEASVFYVCLSFEITKNHYPAPNFSDGYWHEDSPPPENYI